VLQEALLKLAERIAAMYTGFNPDSAKACETICRTGAAFALSNPPANLDFFSVWHCAARHMQMAAWLLGSYCLTLLATLRLCRCTYQLSYPVRKRAHASVHFISRSVAARRMHDVFCAARHVATNRN
jgi:hypothetical protein